MGYMEGCYEEENDSQRGRAEEYGEIEHVERTYIVQVGNSKYEVQAYSIEQAKQKWIQDAKKMLIETKDK